MQGQFIAKCLVLCSLSLSLVGCRDIQQPRLIPPPPSITITPAMTSVPVFTAAPTFTPAPIFSNATSTMPPATPPSPEITMPKDGDVVDSVIDVAGSGAQAALGSGTYLYVVVHPVGLLAYYVQQIPRIQADGTWRSSPVYIGDSTPASVGKSFQICAVLHSQQLQPGELSLFPTGPKSCITVKRQ